MSDLSPNEIRLLAPCIHALEMLERGERKPRTALQRHFLNVCKGECPARTAYERAYLKWRESKPDLLKLQRDIRTAKAKRSPVQDRANGNLQIARQRERRRKIEFKKIEEQAKRREAADIARQKQKYKIPTRRVQEWGTREDWKKDRDSWRR
jgi:uncharacterized protein YifE (UPF0438 family)